MNRHAQNPLGQGFARYSLFAGCSLKLVRGMFAATRSLDIRGNMFVVGSLDVRSNMLAEGSLHVRRRFAGTVRGKTNLHVKSEHQTNSPRILVSISSKHSRHVRLMFAA